MADGHPRERARPALGWRAALRRSCRATPPPPRNGCSAKRSGCSRGAGSTRSRSARSPRRPSSATSRRSTTTSARARGCSTPSSMRHGDPTDVARGELLDRGRARRVDPRPRRRAGRALRRAPRRRPTGRDYLRIVAQLSAQFSTWREPAPGHRAVPARDPRHPRGSARPSCRAAVRRERVVEMIMLMTVAMAERARRDRVGTPRARARRADLRREPHRRARRRARGAGAGRGRQPVNEGAAGLRRQSGSLHCCASLALSTTRSTMISCRTRSCTSSAHRTQSPSVRALELGRGQETEYLNHEGAVVQWAFNAL